LKAIPDIATPIVNGTKNLFQFLWLQTKQGWLLLGLLFYCKKVSLKYFENIQQDLINEVPAYLCWDAKYFYRATINDINVTFDKTPLLTSDKYTGKFVLTVHGLFSKTTKVLSLKVKSYEQTKKIKEVNPKYSERKTEKFLEIEGALIKIPRPKIMAKKTPIKTKLQKLSLKTEKIVNSNFVESLKENSTFHNYHQEFINEQKK
jgi:hypothetical protein